MSLKAIIAIDPGEATGIARVLPAVGYDGCWSMDALEACDWIVESAEGFGKGLIIVYEVFRPRNGVRHWQPAAVEVTGVIKWAAHKYGCGVVGQEVADAKAFVPNQRLRDVEWWRRGAADHAHDAARHLLLYLARINRYDGKSVKYGDDA